MLKSIEKRIACLKAKRDRQKGRVCNYVFESKLPEEIVVKPNKKIAKVILRKRY